MLQQIEFHLLPISLIDVPQYIRELSVFIIRAYSPIIFLLINNDIHTDYRFFGLYFPQ